MLKNKILFQLTGSIACFKACQLLSKLVQAGYDIEVVASRAALNFVGEATLEGLTGKPVHVETFERGSYMDHIRLVRWADLCLLCPASANAINKLAAGIGDDLISTLFLAHDFKKPYLIAPAMNTQMMKHPATQASLSRLAEWGIEILGSGEGVLACGEIGEGRLLEPDQLFSEIETRLGSAGALKTSRPLSVLVTSGGTQESIDGVRSITNSSTGQTGATIADCFAMRGHQVTLLQANNSVSPKTSVRTFSFQRFNDLQSLIHREISERDYDVVIHAAAVSDYSVAEIKDSDGREADRQTKIDSHGDLILRLKRNPKIVNEIKSLSRNKAIRLIAFKLTNTLDSGVRQGAVQNLLQNSSADFVVHNDLSDVSDERHVATIYAQSKSEVAVVTSKQELAATLERIVRKD